MHIGMIGGIGPAATEFYYRNLVKAYASSNKPLDLTIVHAELADLVGNIVTNSTDKQADIFNKLAQRLQAAGADVIAISSIAGHFCISEFEKLTSLPVVSAIAALEFAIKERGLRRFGILGSRITMESRLFGGISSAEVVIPPEQDLGLVHDEYLRMATTGQVDNRQRELIFTIGKNMCVEQGAETVVLAGTDLFLAFDGYDCGFDTVDSALVHIDYLCSTSDR